MMLSPPLQALAERYVAEYTRQTPKSKQVQADAESCMAGGDTRHALFHLPYPVCFTKGHGCQLTDVDDRTYFDLLNNYGSLIHGHAFPPVVEAIQRQCPLGTSIGVCEAQTKLAKHLANRIHGADQVRFCNSGTESTMLAIRAAKAITGRRKIVKMEGGYHGWHDATEVSVFPFPLEGSDDAPSSVLGSKGLFEGIINDVVVAPFNNVGATRQLIEELGPDLACVIMEPMMAGVGMLPASKEYLHMVREATRSTGAMMILDEVQTFRLGYGGYQQVAEVVPDLTCMAKMIGGGLPVGAIAGPKGIMSVFDPHRPDKLTHSGTYNGNALTMVAGLAAMEAYTSEEVARLNALGDCLRGRISGIFSEIGMRGQVTGYGSLLNIHFAPQTAQLIDFRSAVRQSAMRSLPMLPVLHLGLVNQGVHLASRGCMALSTAFRSEESLDPVVKAFEVVLRDIHQAETANVSNAGNSPSVAAAIAAGGGNGSPGK